ncbi:MAG: hypothetical protein ACP5KN_15460 [Armatimonadota bacterium]
MNAEGSKQPGTRIEVVGELNQPITYANYAKVQLTPYEGMITFARIDPATAVGDVGEDTAATVDAPAVARFALPHVVIRGLYIAIQKQIERHPDLGLAIEEGQGESTEDV